MSDEKNGRVLEFPSDKVSKKHTLKNKDAPSAEREIKFRWTLPLKSLTAIVLGVTVVNFSITLYKSNPVNTPMRGLASTGKENFQIRNFEVEKSISTALSDLSSRDLASIGRRPTSEDKLLFETLHGRYNVRKIKGKINQLRFTSEGEGPLTIDDRRYFLQHNRHLFPGVDQKVENTGREVLPHRILESYDLISSDKRVARVFFELDLQERLISLKVERNQSNGQ